MKSQLITILITTLISGSLGFGLSQSTLATTVARLDVAVASLHSAIDIEIDTRKDMDKGLQKQISDLVALQKAQVEQASQLISLIKVQNQMLSR